MTASDCLMTIIRSMLSMHRAFRIALQDSSEAHPKESPCQHE